MANDPVAESSDAALAEIEAIIEDYELTEEETKLYYQAILAGVQARLTETV